MDLAIQKLYAQNNNKGEESRARIDLKTIVFVSPSSLRNYAKLGQKTEHWLDSANWQVTVDKVIYLMQSGKA